MGSTEASKVVTAAGAGAGAGGITAMMKSPSVNL